MIRVIRHVVKDVFRHYYAPKLRYTLCRAVKHFKTISYSIHGEQTAAPNPSTPVLTLHKDSSLYEKPPPCISLDDSHNKSRVYNATARMTWEPGVELPP